MLVTKSDDTWVQFWGPTWWKDRTDSKIVLGSQKLCHDTFTYIYAGICMHTYIHSHIQIKNLKRLEGLESWLRSTCCSWGGHRFCFHPPTTTCNPYFRGSDALFWLLQALHYTAYIQTKRHMIQIQMIFLFILLFFCFVKTGFFCVALAILEQINTFLKESIVGQWEHSPLIPALRRQRQADLCEFKATLRMIQSKEETEPGDGGSHL